MTQVFTTPFDKLVDELKSKLKLKDDTSVGDVILIAKEISSGETAADFAQVAGFTADPTKRDEWWHVRLLFLGFPLVNTVFTLQTPHFTGKEVFTMGGKKVFIKALDPEAFCDSDEGGPPPRPPWPPAPGGPPSGKPGFKLVK
ncbi:MAG: hypothetical protein LBQ12_01920 [Deltaproteobacteria bacterium]|nr:hypothetical protein [Deltaproteobacteria bacterium]